MTFTSPLPSISVPASPLTPYVLERAGQAYAQGGRGTEAEAAWKKALTLATDGAARKRIRQALKKK